MIGPEKFAIPSGFSLEQSLNLLHSIARDQYQNLRNNLNIAIEKKDNIELPRLSKSLESLLYYVNDGMKRIEKAFKLKTNILTVGENDSTLKESVEDLQLLGYDIRLARRDAQLTLNGIEDQANGRSLTKLWRRNSTRKIKNESLDDSTAIKEAERILENRKRKLAEKQELERKRLLELENQRKKLMDLQVRQQVDLEVASKLEEEELKRKELELLEREREERLAREKALKEQEEAKLKEMEEQERLRKEVQRQFELHKEQERKERERQEKLERQKEVELTSVSNRGKKQVSSSNDRSDIVMNRRSIDMGSANRDHDRQTERKNNGFHIGRAAQVAWTQFQPDDIRKRYPVSTATTMLKKPVSTIPKLQSYHAPKKRYEYTKPVINRVHIKAPKKAQTSVATDSNSREVFTKAIRRTKSQSAPSSPVLADQPRRSVDSKRPAKSSESPKRYMNERIQSVMDTLEGVDKMACEHILNDILVVDEKVYWDDIAGLRNAKNSLKEAVVYPFLRPDLFKGLREPIRGMLLFGPPGTGKTMIAKAVATESNSVFFSISASSLLSKYLGESEKLVRALFYLAKRLAPSIIFIDEIDSLLTARSDNENESSRRIKTEVLIQWSSLSNIVAQNENSGGLSDNRVLVLAATNLPWAIDEAARRRFSRRVYIPLPDYDTRLMYITKLLSKQPNNLTISEYEEVARMTEGYSGSDLTALAKEAAMEPIREVGDRLMDIKNETIRGVTFEDFKNALATTKKSVSQQSLKQFDDWSTEYGSTGV